MNTLNTDHLHVGSNRVNIFPYHTNYILFRVIIPRGGFDTATYNNIESQLIRVLSLRCVNTDINGTLHGINNSLVKNPRIYAAMENVLSGLRDYYTRLRNHKDYVQPYIFNNNGLCRVIVDFEYVTIDGKVERTAFFDDKNKDVKGKAPAHLTNWRDRMAWRLDLFRRTPWSKLLCFRMIEGDKYNRDIIEVTDVIKEYNRQREQSKVLQEVSRSIRPVSVKIVDNADKWQQPKLTGSGKSGSSNGYRKPQRDNNIKYARHHTEPSNTSFDPFAANRIFLTGLDTTTPTSESHCHNDNNTYDCGSSDTGSCCD